MIPQKYIFELNIFIDTGKTFSAAPNGIDMEYCNKSSRIGLGQELFQQHAFSWSCLLYTSISYLINTLEEELDMKLFVRRCV